MKKKLIISLGLLLFVIEIFFSSTHSFCQQDPPHRNCCFWIFSTGVFLGEANSTARYSLVSDTQLITGLFNATNALEVANTLSSSENEAWPAWKAMQADIDRLATRLASDPSPQKREEVVKFTDFFRESLATRLRKMTVRDSYEKRIIQNDTCAAHYFRIGYLIGFAHHAFQVALEGGPFADEARKLGLARMAQALASIRALSTVRPWAGYCVELWRPEYIIPTIRKMFQVNPEPDVEELVLLARTAKEKTAEALLSGNQENRINLCPGTDELLTEKGRLWGNQQFLRDRKVLNDRIIKLRHSQATQIPSQAPAKPVPVPKTLKKEPPAHLDEEEKIPLYYNYEFSINVPGLRFETERDLDDKDYLSFYYKPFGQEDYDVPKLYGEIYGIPGEPVVLFYVNYARLRFPKKADVMNLDFEIECDIGGTEIIPVLDRKIGMRSEFGNYSAWAIEGQFNSDYSEASGTVTFYLDPDHFNYPSCANPVIKGTWSAKLVNKNIYKTKKQIENMMKIYKMKKK